MKYPNKSHPGHGDKRGKPGALPKLHYALQVSLNTSSATLPCAGCGKKVRSCYTWPDTRNPGHYTLLPKCPACAAKMVASQLPTTPNPNVILQSSNTTTPPDAPAQCHESGEGEKKMKIVYGPRLGNITENYYPNGRSKVYDHYAVSDEIPLTATAVEIPCQITLADAEKFCQAMNAWQLENTNSGPRPLLAGRAF